MRFSFYVRAAAVVALGFLGVASATTPNTPADNSPNYQGECALDGLSFTNGLAIVGTFAPNKFHYQCSCANFAGTFTTVVKPHLMDAGSSAEITFNGVETNFRTMGNAISNGGAQGGVPNSPLTQSSPLTFKTGTNTIIVGVGCNNRAQPQPCYYQYFITCDKPADGGFVVGDPQFVGLRGQSYQIHGVSGEVYNIVSDADIQYNSRFVFLDQGACPTVNGKKQKGCWSHPGSYLGELGLKTRAGDKIHLSTGDAKTGFAAVEVNGKALAIGDTVLLADNMGSVSLNSTHLASVQVGNWDFAFENSDMFVNQRVRVIDARGLRSHGLLGQTWREATYPNAIKYIQGQVDDYVIRDNDIFGDNFVFNTFN
jgi:hypothetical protein